MTTFRLYGLPVPQGSTRAFMVKGRPIVTHASKNVKPWRQDVAASAREAGATVQAGPIALVVTFYLPRPKSLPKRATYPAKRPDVDKLLRAVLDALTGIAWTDDGQVTHVGARKLYATAEDPPGARVWIDAVPDGGQTYCWCDDAQAVRDAWSLAGHIIERQPLTPTAGPGG